jgi:hypothetical protein
MTTIAYKDGILAADSRETMDGSGGSVWIVRDDDDEKIAKLTIPFDPLRRDGDQKPPPPAREYLFAGAHISSEIEMIRRTLVNFVPLDECSHEFVEVECILIDCESEKIWYTDGLQWVEMKAPYIALGSGAPHALTAMDSGLDAIKAVHMGIKRDVYSGGRVRSLRTNRVQATPSDDKSTST